jgi:hypothetical protein
MDISEQVSGEYFTIQKDSVEQKQKKSRCFGSKPFEVVKK